MNGWKVLSCRRESARASQWWASYECYRLSYPVDVEVKPKVEGTKLFFFKSYQDACKFYKRHNGEIIVPCIAKGVSKPQKVGHMVEQIDSFWKSRKGKKLLINARDAPKGTYFADSIICTA